MDQDQDQDQAAAPVSNPVDNASSLKHPLPGQHTEPAHPQQDILPGDSATTRAEKIERHGSPVNGVDSSEGQERAAKRVKVDGDNTLKPAEASPAVTDDRDRQKGFAAIKAEFVIPHISGRQQDAEAQYDDDAAEAAGKGQADQDTRGGKSRNKAKGGQNKARTFGSSRDALQLCKSRVLYNEFSAVECHFGNKCKFEHNLRTYLKDGKREDLTTFNSLCPVFQVKGKCNAGWKCRFAGSHSKEVDHEDGKKELVLVDNQTEGPQDADDEDDAPGVVNVVPLEAKIQLRKKKMKLDKSEQYNDWLDKRQALLDKKPNGGPDKAGDTEKDAAQDNRAMYIEPPFLPSEKRRLYYGPETPVLAPLTTQGNLPFRRLAVSLGAQVTWSEMAMGMPLIQGEKGEFALMKAHESELTSPNYSPKSPVAGYDNSKDLRFGAQIAGNKPWLAMKTTEVITSLCPHLRAIDLNCGCPIDLVYRQGAGSALLDNPGRLEKILRGMNAVSNEVPITVKIRMGTRDNHPTADKLVQRFVLGGDESRELGEGPSGVAAITLHGRSRQQRYTKSANWEYISQCAATISRLQKEQASVTDTVREPDARGLSASNNGNVYFLGNGDCYSHVDYYDALDTAKVDSVMIGRGALTKPWLFEEIESRQYLDKSATERLAYVEQFARNGLEYWGSDEIGVGTTRRFLLEWLSFACRYVPLGILEHLPPRLGERPPPFKGRDELETLLSSPNYKDWIKISEMFLGPAHKDFQFQPKHKSNSYEIEAEG